MPVTQGKARSVNLPFMSDELWKAVSDGGQLVHVDSPELLAALARAYHGVRTCVMLEGHYMDALHFAGLRQSTPQHDILRYITELDESCIGAIEAAIFALDGAGGLAKAGQ
jgi:hypothetical protein